MPIVLRNVTAEVVDLEFEKVPPKNPQHVMVRGQISKQIIYGAAKGIVNYQNAIDPFEVMIDLPELADDTKLQIRAEVEHISPRLLHNGPEVDQQIILKVYIDTGDWITNQVQNFLIRSVNYLTDLTDPATDQPSIETTSEPKKSFQSIKVKAKQPGPEPKIIPIPDVSLIITEKIEELEDLLHDELEDSLRRKLHSELEDSLRRKIEDQVIQSVEHNLRSELEESIFHRLRQEFEVKLEDKLAVERQLIKEELRQQERVERNNYHEAIRKKSIHQQRNGYRVKG